MIEKILDNYYARVVEEKIKQFMLNYRLNYKFEELNGGVHLMIKRPEYNDEQYVSIYGFWKDEAIYELCQFEILTRNNLTEAIKRYSEETRKQR